MANYRDRRVGQEIMREVNDILNKRIRRSTRPRHHYYRCSCDR